MTLISFRNMYIQHVHITEAYWGHIIQSLAVCTYYGSLLVSHHPISCCLYILRKLISVKSSNLLLYVHITEAYWGHIIQSLAVCTYYGSLFIQILEYQICIVTSNILVHTSNQICILLCLYLIRLLIEHDVLHLDYICQYLSVNPVRKYRL